MGKERHIARREENQFSWAISLRCYGVPLLHGWLTPLGLLASSAVHHPPNPLMALFPYSHGLFQIFCVWQNPICLF